MKPTLSLKGSTLLAACLLAMQAPAAHAATTTWIASGGGSWEAEANWSAGVPQALDVAVVAPSTRPASSITLNVATTVAGLTLANINMSVRANLTVTGAVSWSEATAFPGLLTFSNASTVRFQGPVTLTGDGFKATNNTGLLALSGTTLWTGNTAAGGNSLFSSATAPGSIIRNSGAFTDANAFDTAISGRGVFDNQGNFAKTGAAVTRVDVADFRNSGAVTVTAGTLVLAAMSGVHTGNWHADAGAVLDFAGGTPTLLGSTSGTGSLRISGGTVTVEGAGHGLPVLLDGGKLAGSYQVFDGPVTWRAGTLSGSGTTILTGTLALEGSGAKTIESGRQVIAYGLTTLSSGQQLIIGQGAPLQTTFTNAGDFRDGEAGSRTLLGFSRDFATFVNAGTYVKSGDGFTTVQSLVFDNQGTLDVRAGLMRFTTAQLMNSGVIRISAGGGLLNTVGIPLENTGTLEGDGAMDSTAGIVNRGLISPGGSIGMLTMGNVTLAPEGTLKIELGAAGHDLLKLTGTVLLGGTLDLWNTGYAPQLGDSLTVLEFASRQGSAGFDAIQLHGFGPDVAFDVLYGAGDVRLVVTSVPEPGAASLAAAGLALLGLLGVKRRRRNDT